ncbi:hypothetical protein CDAR_427931 [Caerostris darwini]|uniref:Uncharacterized protein n=1 Tax=Caerostris darwini TaxID=1538125 RepID=A0AAV4V8I2_9ARAC|nr:hypothetical protein CDAR_427931 [Caerostris darwini]
MLAKVLIICAALAAAQASVMGSIGYRMGKGMVAVPTIATVSSQKAVINHVAPAALVAVAAAPVALVGNGMLGNGVMVGNGMLGNGIIAGNGMLGNGIIGGHGMLGNGIMVGNGMLGNGVIAGNGMLGNGIIGGHGIAARPMAIGLGKAIL